MMTKTTIQRFFYVIALFAVLGAPLAAAAPVQAQSGNQWRMDFFNNSDWQGGSSFTQYSSLLNFNWGLGSPAPNVPVDYFTGRFTTDAFFYAGTYRFSILADDDFKLIIDGSVVFDTIDKGQAGKQQVFDVGMYQGNHTVRVDFREVEQTAYIYVDWQYLKPGTPSAPPVYPPSQPVPPNNGSQIPASQSSVQTTFGDFTPCIQQGLHQSECFQSDGAWNSPNLGSVQLEPKIDIWMNCEPADSDQTWISDATTDPVTTKTYRCSKTLAGYFAR